MKELIAKSPRFLFFTGKGGVGKTSMSCVVAVSLADRGKRVLLISTDPASNLDEALETNLSGKPRNIKGQANLSAMNIDPVQAAYEYRERIVAPYRRTLPKEAVQSIEEQLSGACTVEIAGFNEFSRFIGDEKAIENYDHVILDTAPTGHTLRLLNLPSAWNDFIIENKTGSSCLGPLSGLKEQRWTYEKALKSLTDKKKTLLVLVSRAENIALKEAARASVELGLMGMKNQHLIINGIFHAASEDETAKSFARKSKEAIAGMPKGLSKLPRTSVAYNPRGLTGLKAISDAADGVVAPYEPDIAAQLKNSKDIFTRKTVKWSKLLDQIAEKKSGLIMTMGKGGVGKTSMAAAIAIELAERGHNVRISTTDPAAHILDAIDGARANLTVSNIDPKKETIHYVEAVLKKNRGILSDDGMSLLEEELRSPCIEEIAVFQAFARTVAQAEDGFMVLDTAPTGHTLLLLDATESYHREVARNSGGGISDDVGQLLPRLRNSEFTKVLIVTLPEATPVHEAQRLQDDLRRAKIEPFAWIINQSFALSSTADPALSTRGMSELKYIDEVRSRLADKTVLSPWLPYEVKGIEKLKLLINQSNRRKHYEK
jgi:arsenite-transporting ATPase